MRSPPYRLICCVGVVLATCAAQAWQPAPDSMLTTWGEKVSPATAWRDYPRPALARTTWSNLNGLWSYAITDALATVFPAQATGEILVPYAIESALSGVKRRLTAEDVLWYQRAFVPPSASKDHHIFLNFEAVDFQCTVWVNATRVGTHTGGNLPFSFDVTAALTEGENLVTVRVTDATNTPGAYQLHGKQVVSPSGIWYTPVTGIWQTVWLETVPADHVSALRITPRINGTVTIEINPGAAACTVPATVTTSLRIQTVATATAHGNRINLTIPSPQLWSPDSPTLYDLVIRFGDDTVSSYVGLRETSVMKDSDGRLRLALNGKPLFHWGTLDQGWWPDGLLTPPSDAAMRSDLEFLKAAGFNTVRKHIKVEPRRYYTH